MATLIRISPPLVILIFLSILTTPTSSHSPPKISYTKHCNSVVVEPTSNGHELEPLGFLQLQGGYFRGGQEFLSTTRTPDFMKSANFHTNGLSKTDTEGVLRVQATLTLNDGQIYLRSLHSYTMKLHHHGWRAFHDGHVGRVSFELQGFWSESSGKLCMVGSGHTLSEEGDYIQLSAVAKINYPKRSTINTSIVTGIVESIDSEISSSYFNPISVLGFSQKTYSYSLVTEIEGMCRGDDYQGKKSQGLEPGTSICSKVKQFETGTFQLNYRDDCSAGKCSLFDEFLPEFMLVGGIQCSSEGKVHMYLQFSNLSSAWPGMPLIPETALVAEGVWDEEKNQLCVVGCPLKNFEASLAETHVGDCSVALSLTFPKVWSLKMRSPAVGSIWSLRKFNESMYFNRIEYRSLSHRKLISDLTYNYTELGLVKNSCAKKDMKKRLGKTFPDGSSFRDMRFDMYLKTKSRRAWGSATPVSLGDVVFDQYSSLVFPSTSIPAESNITAAVSNSNHNILHGSYSIDYSIWDGNTSEAMHLSAEGIYDAETGTLCMVGCRSLGVDGEKTVKNLTLDCKILININLSPYNSKAGEHLEGTIRSTREKKDALHFDELELSSHDIYEIEAEETISRVDLEIAIVLSSLTLACVFIGLQLYYVKKHPNVLPSISIVMLVVLTLGHLIPLVLNFEAFFFRDRNQQNLILRSGGWLEANEVIVRVLTMVAFLLQLHLLQLTFSARLAESGKNNLWDAEKLAARVCLLLYFAGGLTAWLVHSNKFKDTESLKSHHSGWKNPKSFAGLILDGFLLPQILLNLFWDSRVKALALSYYGGTTIVRLLPHAYDAYRAHKSLPHVNSTYIYAEPDWDLYSATWDVIIPCGGLLFAFLIFLQQMFGGAFVLPWRFRQSAEDKKVPV